MSDYELVEIHSANGQPRGPRVHIVIYRGADKAAMLAVVGKCHKRRANCAIISAQSVCMSYEPKEEKR